MCHDYELCSKICQTNIIFDLLYISPIIEEKVIKNHEKTYAPVKSCVRARKTLIRRSSVISCELIKLIRK